MHKVKFIVECDMSKDIKDFDKIIAGRIYVIDGVEAVEVTAAPESMPNVEHCLACSEIIAAAPTTPKGAA